MKLFYQEKLNRYWLDCSFEERKEAKKLKFTWLEDEKGWFTKNWVDAYTFFVEKCGQNILSKLIDGSASWIMTVYEANLESSVHTGNNPFLYKPNKELFDYQQAGVDAIRARHNVLLADEPGLGKTAQVISFLIKLEADYALKVKTLIICPSSLKINWQREFLKWSNIPEADIEIIRSGKFKIDQSKRILIVNYDLLKSRMIMDQLTEYAAEVIALDEAHYIKNATSIRTKAAIKLGKKAKKVIGITGTPVLNRPMELYSFLSNFSPETIAPYKDFKRFAYRFCGAYQGQWGFVTDGATNLEELNLRLRATCMIRREKKDVLTQLPERMSPQIIAFEQDKETKAVVKKEAQLDIETLKRSPEKFEIGEAAKIRHELALAKLPQCIKYIEDQLTNGEKLVIFAYHRDVIMALANHFHKPPYKDGFWNHRKVLGGMTDNEKQEAIDTFQNNPQCKIFIGQIQAAGVGITLTAASRVIFVESSWTPGEINQCIDRCHRIGQKNSVTSTFLTVENSIEETMLKVIFDKEKTIKKIMK